MEPKQAASHRVLIPTSSALDELRMHAEHGSSGEFIYAAEKQEIHVYMQRGRLAWAVDSSTPLSFVRAISDRCGASASDLQQALETARVERRSLGETLTQWKLATWMTCVGQCRGSWWRC